MLRRLTKSLFILLLIVGCAVNIGHNPILTLNIATKNSEEWCLKECEKYDYPDLILTAMLIAGYESPECICMRDCMKLDSTYCVDSNMP